ncbi:MAG: metallophosphoesterase, partial [Pseudomonadota bacterium]
MPRSLNTLLEPVFLILAALAMSAPAVAESEWQFDNVERVYALADIHGAYDAMVTTLENAGVIDAEGAWIAGESHLVICGDILDRGPDSRPAMDLLMRLEDEALAAGGRVHVLLGNHEAMNLVGDLRYVSRAEYAAFEDDESTEDRDRWFEAWAARSSNAEGAPAELRARFDERFPPGFFAHRRAFATDGKYGSWLLDKPLVVVVNRTAFVHGGLSPLIGEIGLEGVNRRLAGDIGRYVEDYETLIDAELLLPTDNFYTHVERLNSFMAGPNTAKATVSAVGRLKEMAESDVHSQEGPMWYRGNAHCSKLIEHDRLAATLAAIGADRVVIGHTPTPGRQVLERFNGQIIEIDTGMLNAYYKGRGHALLLEGESVRVVPEIEGSSSGPISAPRRVGSRSGGALSAEALEELLASGEISATRNDA